MTKFKYIGKDRRCLNKEGKPEGSIMAYEADFTKGEAEVKGIYVDKARSNPEFEEVKVKKAKVEK
jgi:hypothetical protein